MGYEPMTSCLLDSRSNQLSYGARCFCLNQDIVFVVVVCFVLFFYWVGVK